MHDRKILLGGSQQQVARVANRIAMLQRAEIGDHGGAHRKPRRENASSRYGAFLLCPQVDEHGDEHQHEVG